MAKLVLSDLAFGNLGIEIGSDIELEPIADSMSGLLDRAFFFDSLDLTGVDDQTGLTVRGVGASPGRGSGVFGDNSLYMGNLSILDPTVEITGFETLRLTQKTALNHGQSFTINSGKFEYSVDGTVQSGRGTVLFDASLDSIDFYDVEVPLFITIESGGDEVSVHGGKEGDLIDGMESGGYVEIFGAGGDDQLLGSGILSGGVGDDVLYGSGNLSGGDGDDTLVGSGTLSGGDGDDVLEGSGTLSGGDGADTINGSLKGGDDIYGDAGDDVIDGRGTVSGGDGDDVISGSGTLSGGNGDDVLDGIGTLSGGGGDDFLEGSGTLSGDDGDDEIHGAAKDDNLSGGEGNDEISGNAGNDYIYGDAGDDDLNGDIGDDWLEGGAGRDKLSGWDGNDTLLGGDGDDLLVGEYGDDFLDGGAGNDRLYPRIGKDRLEGGTGRDRFEVSTADQHFYTSGDPVTDSVVSPTRDSNEQDEILDFSAADDLFILSEGQLVRGYSPFENTIVYFSKGADSDGNYVRFVEEGDWNSDSTVRDETGAIDSGNLLFRVPQYDPSESEPQEYKSLDKVFLTESEPPEEFYLAQDGIYASYSETYQRYEGYYEEHDGSYEVHFASASQSQGADFDVFSYVKFDHDDSDSITSGQDKFDLRGVSDTRFKPGDTEIADIIFTIIEDDDSWGTAIDLLNSDSDNDVVDDFFYDTSAEGAPQRAVHVEYLAQRGGEEGYDSLMVYFDADEDGNFSLNRDLFFQILDPQKADGSFYDNDLTSVDLYDDPSGDGSGTGILIFNVDQYNFWYT